MEVKEVCSVRSREAIHMAGLTVCSAAGFKDGSPCLLYVACGLLVFEAGDCFS
jgi:hypothetical protein